MTNGVPIGGERDGPLPNVTCLGMAPSDGSVTLTVAVVVVVVVAAAVGVGTVAEEVAVAA